MNVNKKTTIQEKERAYVVRQQRFLRKQLKAARKHGNEVQIFYFGQKLQELGGLV